MATPPPLDPLSLLIKFKLAPMVKSAIALGGQCFGCSHVSVTMAKCSPFSSKSIIRESTLSTIERALAHAKFSLLLFFSRVGSLPEYSIELKDEIVNDSLLL